MNGNRVDYITQQQSVKPVNLKGLKAQQPGDQALAAKGIDDGEAIGNGGQEHGQHCDTGNGALVPAGYIGAVDCVGQHERDNRGDERAGPGDDKAARQSVQKACAAQYSGVACQAEAAVHIERLDEQQYQWSDKEHREDGDNDPENNPQLQRGTRNSPAAQPRPRFFSGRITGHSILRTVRRYCCA